MDQKADDEMKEFIEGIADDLGYTRRTENKWHWNGIFDYMPRGKSLVIGAAFILTLIVLIVLFFGNSGKISTEDMIYMQQRLEHIEDRLAFFEGIDNKISKIESLSNQLQKSISKIDRAERLVEERLDKLGKRLDLYKKELATAQGKAKAKLVSERKTVSTGKAVYHVVRTGESLYRIAQQHGISVDVLCSLNNLNKTQTLSIGQKLLIFPSHRQ